MAKRIENGTKVIVLGSAFPTLPLYTPVENRPATIVEFKLSAKKVERYRVKYDGSNLREWLYRNEFTVQN